MTNKPRPLDELLAAAEQATEAEERARQAQANLVLHLKSYREATGLSQSSLASSLGKSQEYISQVEQGHRPISLSTAEALKEMAKQKGATSGKNKARDND